LFQIPSNLILVKVGAPLWLGCMLALWGAVAALCAFITSAAQFMTLRFLLGIAECGAFPGVLLYVLPSQVNPYRHDKRTLKLIAMCLMQHTEMTFCLQWSSQHVQTCCSTGQMLSVQNLCHFGAQPSNILEVWQLHSPSQCNVNGQA
jgi:hypothetical protein